jgi:CRP-like cAMP-binding protein
LYHKYCARLIVAWGGALGRTIRNTSAGREFMEEMEKIKMDDVRKLIRRLIDTGYDRRVPSMHSEQEIYTIYEAGVRQIDLARDLKTTLSLAALNLQDETNQFRVQLEKMEESLVPICAEIDSHPVNQNRRASLSGNSDCSFQASIQTATHARIDASNGSIQRSALSQELNALIRRGKVSDKVVQTEENEPYIHSLDSDEEVQLHAELDALIEMQERVEAIGGNQNKYMASVFQKACLQITDIEAMYHDLTDVFRQASSPEFSDSVPAVSLKEFAIVLDILNLSDVRQSELEVMFEQGLRYVPFCRATNVVDTAGLANPNQSSLDLDLIGHSEVDDEDDADDSDDDDPRVSMPDMVVGSADFRSRIMLAVTDDAFCFMMQAVPFRHLSVQQIKTLSLGGKMRKVAKGELFCSLQDMTTPSFLKYSSTQATNLYGDSHKINNNQVARVRSKSPIRGAKRSQSKEIAGERDVLGSWFLVVSGNLIIEDDPLHLERKLYSELGPGCIFGGYFALSDHQTPFVIKAVKGCQLLELPLRTLLSFRSEETEDPGKIISLAANMGEAPIAALTRASSVLGESAVSENSQNQVLDGAFPETKIHSMKTLLSTIDQVWQEISFGEKCVPLTQFVAFQPYLGEIGSELFKKLFTVKGLPAQITRADFWEIWFAFLTSEAYGKKDLQKLSTEDELQTTESKLHCNDEFEEGPVGFFEYFLAYVSSARRIGHRLFDEDVMERYESCFVNITGDVGAPLAASKVKSLLELVFPDFQYRFSGRNCHEFLHAFGRDGVKSKQISFAEIRKVLLERSKGTHSEGRIFMHGFLNPYSSVFFRWMTLVKAVATFHYFMVPIRLCFVPWNNMLDLRALSIDLTVDIITVAHVLILANTAYRNSRAQWVTNRMKIFRRLSLNTVISALPMDWFAFVFGASYEMCNWLRVNKLCLSYQILLRENINVARQSARNRLLELFLGIVALLHSAACIWYYLGTRYKEWQPDYAVSWFEIDKKFYNITQRSYQHRFGLRDNSTLLDRYLMSAYWVTTTLTSYGIVGDMLPANDGEIIYSMILMVLNVTIFGFLIGEVSSIVMMQDEEVAAARTQLGAVESFVKGSQLEDDLRDEIKQHFKATRMHSSSDQAVIFRRMSRCLQVEVSSYTTRGYLDGVPLFQGCSSQLMDAICVLLVEVNFAPEEYLYRASEIARDMFFIIDGSVDEITESEKGEKVDATIKPGGTTGVLSFFFGMRRLGSARAGKLAGAVCLRLSREEFMDMLTLYPEEEAKVAQAAMKTFEGARSHFGSRRAQSRAPTSKTGLSRDIVGGAGVETMDTISDLKATDDEDKASSDAFTQALGGSGIRMRMAALKKRRENKRVYGMLTAAEKGDLARLRSNLSHDGDSNICDHFRRTPLHIAASEGQLEAVRLLLHSKADAGSRDQFDNTPLNDAVRHRHDAVAALIRERSAGSALNYKGHEIGGLMCQVYSIFFESSQLIFQQTVGGRRITCMIAGFVRRRPGAHTTSHCERRPSFCMRL